MSRGKVIYDIRGKAPPSDVKVIEIKTGKVRYEPPTFWDETKNRIICGKGK